MKQIETDRDNKERNRTVKNRKNCLSRKLASEFLEDVVPTHMIHKGIDRHQKDAMRNLKKELTDTDMTFHIDFAENYNCKFGKAIQETNRPK